MGRSLRRFMTKTKNDTKKFEKGSGKYIFSIVEGKKTSIPGYMFLRGKLKGLVFQFANVYAEEEKDDTGTHPLHIDYVILHNPPGLPPESKYLERGVHHVAVTLLEEQLKDGKLITKEDVKQMIEEAEAAKNDI